MLLCAALLAAFGWGQPPHFRRGRDIRPLFPGGGSVRRPWAGDALRAEPLYIESGEVRDTRELAEYLVTELLAGPEDAALTSAIPEETTLLSLELDGTRAKVDLSSRYRLLSGVALALADYAITLTLTQLPEISAVSVTVRGQPLAYRDRQIFTARDVLFSSNEDVIDTLNATLYFLDETGRPDAGGDDTRPVRGGHAGRGRGQGPAGGDGGKGLALRHSGGVPGDFRPAGREHVLCGPAHGGSAGSAGGGGSVPALRALADSLLSLRAVEEVRYLVDGEFASAYGGAAVLEPYLSAA